MLGAGLASVQPVEAGETIFDPENPGFEEEEDDDENEDGEPEDDKSQESDDTSDDGSLIIEDPERPDLPGDSDDDPGDESDGDDGDHDEVDREEVAAGSGFRDTEWTLDYGIGLLVDPGIGPDGYDAFEVVGGLGMELRHEMSARTSAVVSGDFSYWAGAGQEFDQWRTHFEPRLDRAYLTHRPKNWSLSFGKMRNSWGSTDIIRPGDVIDPAELRDPRGTGGFATGAGQLSATATYSSDDWSLRGVFVPFFTDNRTSLFGRDTSLTHERNPMVGEQLPFLLAADALRDENIHLDTNPFVETGAGPRALPKNVSGGLRGTTTVSGTDLGVGVFYGWDRTPWVELDESLRVAFAADGEFDPEEFDEEEDFELPAADEAVDAEYLRRTTLLVDFARYIGPIGLRADVAVSPRRVFYTTDLAPVRRPMVFSAAGLSYERLLGGERPLGVTLEGFWLHPFGADSGPTRWMIAADERGEADDELLLFDDGYYGLATAINWDTGLWDLEATAGAIASISPGDVIGQLAVARSWRPGLTTTLGANIFWGPDPETTLTPGGLWAHASRVNFSVSGRF